MTPVGFSTVRPPGRTMVYSRSAPGAPGFVKSSSWRFLSSKIFFIIVHMSILKKKGAWSSEFPTPMLLTTATRFVPTFFMASMMLVVPSVSIVSPTSAVFPPKETRTPVVSDVMTLATSSAFVTSPCMTVNFGSDKGPSASPPPDPFGTKSFDGSLARATTLSPLCNAWYTASRPVRPVAPKTARDARGGATDGLSGTRARTAALKTAALARRGRRC
mmetsp:Transcript_151258/g.466533  ORF Transcript_151258/g.466533 Transcript_151258/m.466533 type:complete len:217 (-) Transcript_151258:123-773(-)